VPFGFSEGFKKAARESDQGQGRCSRAAPAKGVGVRTARGGAWHDSTVPEPACADGKWFRRDGSANRGNGEIAVQIYLDEAGSFSGFHPVSISAVGALAIQTVN